MILNRFFKPKWQHSDPQIRQEFVRTLNPSDPLLTQMVRQDRNSDVRCTALTRITELDLLRQVFTQDPDTEVQEAAGARLRELMAGTASDSPPLETRMAVLPQLAADGLMDFLAIQGAEPELRLAALAWVEQEDLLAEVAGKDPAADVRLAALERIHEAATLEQVANETRKRDKRVHRLARERLDAMQAEQARLARLEQLCTDLQTLSWDGESGPNAARFTKLEMEWRELEPRAEAEYQERYRLARERFLAQRQQSMARRMAKLDVCTSLETLADRLRSEGELSEELAAQVQETLQSAHDAWAQIGSLEDIEEQRLERRFAQLVQTIQDRQRPLKRDRQRAERLRGALREADKLLHQPSEVHESDLTALQHRWGSLEQPESGELAKTLQAQFNVFLEKLRTRLRRQVEQKDQELQEIQELVDALEQALEEGRLQQAISFHDRARKRLKHNIGLSRKQMMALDERLHSCVPKLNELRGWRRWGTNQAREHLCEEAESLIGLEEDSTVIARRVQEARNAWKSLDHTEGAATKALWKRFDRACEQAYEPCQAYFDAQSKERQAHLERKQVLCERLECLEADTDWQFVDWHEMDRLYRKLQEQWRRIGPVSRADRKKLERRYHVALKHLNTHLDEERQRDLQRRRALIEAVEALADSEDLQAAITAAKQAQAEWHPTVQASRREEQALWKRFRAACDAVFERRQVERQAADDERHANLAHKTALCEEIETLATADAQTLAHERVRIAQIRQQWAEVGVVPKAMYKSTEQRFEMALKQLERREQELQQEQETGKMLGLRERALLCVQLEACCVQEPEDMQTRFEQVRQAWERLSPLSEALELPLRERFDKACQAVLEGGEVRQVLRQELEANLEQKQLLCLRLEVVAAIDSPPEFAQARMEYQVERLSKSFNGRDMGHSKARKWEQAREIQQEWYWMGLLPPAQHELMEARFQRALDALG